MLYNTVSVYESRPLCEMLIFP